MPTDDSLPASDPTAETAGRPPGELGGHTVQPWEQDAVPATLNPSSKDVPPPSLGTPEARTQGPGAGAKTTAAPGNQPTGASPGHGRAIAQETAAPEGPQTTMPGSEGAEPVEKGVPGVPPSQARPPRPPVYKPQNGHEPAPRPPPAQLAQAKAQGSGTQGDALVEAITKAIAENLAKALHQSIAQAVRDAMPLSARSLAQPKVDVGPNLKPAPPKPKPMKAQGEPPKPATPPAPAPPASAVAPSAGVDPSAPSQYGQSGDKPRPGQSGGKAEAPDEQAKPKLAGNPANPAIGQPAQESADRETREGRLA